MSEAPPQIGFVSLGCPKNLVDSERILTQLRAEGYGVSPSYKGADLVVVNTCGFIDSAVEESLDAIGEALAENGKVVVTGCLGVKEDEVRQAHPDVLAVTGPHSYEEVMGAIHQHLPQPHDPYFGLVPEGGVKLTPRHYAYLKISEGCNHRCTFCIIPQLRGDLVSRPIGEVVREAENLVDAGVRELLVVSQDTSAYGVDLKYRQDFIGGDLVQTRLKELCGELGELQAWTRLMYVYPYPSVDDLIPLMTDGQILPYLDMPLQHGSEEVLRAMKRPAATEKVLDRIKGWCEACPDLTLRSTFIVGFPGETEAQFSELLDFLREAQLDRVGCFPYSPVEGATANALPGPVPDEVKEERFARFMEVQSEISAARLAAKVGQSMIVLVDEVSEEGVTARGPGDAPEIDGNVFIEGDWELEPGDFVEVKITGSDEHDLYAEPLDADG
ncbi:MAG: 30S ribosomal protein S12 methylthiotransferase RimO [Candidatus Sedimenticola sp. 20ELBAFRAG]